MKKITERVEIKRDRVNATEKKFKMEYVNV